MSPLTRPATEAPPNSPNFQFLASHHSLLVRYAALAERYLFDDPNSSLIKLRQFAELLACQSLAHVGVETSPQDKFEDLLHRIRDRRIADATILDLFHGVRKAGNAAAHDGVGTRSDALHQLRMARQLAVWFHRAFGNDRGFKAGSFLPPPDPAQATEELLDELHRLREQVISQGQESEQAKTTAAQEAEQRRVAEAKAEAAYGDLNAALFLAEETSALLAQEQSQFAQQLASLQAQAATQTTAQNQAVLAKAQKAAGLLDLDESATRRIIDQQLRDAGWEADTETLNFKKGDKATEGQESRHRGMADSERPGG